MSGVCLSRITALVKSLRKASRALTPGGSAPVDRRAECDGLVGLAR
jgi:hypothetical protein